MHRMHRDRLQGWERALSFAEHVIVDLFALTLMVRLAILVFAVGFHAQEALGIGLAAGLIGAQSARS
jgi:hypothetical protein